MGSAHLRLHAAALFPLAASLAGHPLELGATLTHTEVDSEIGDPLGIERLDEASLSLLMRVGDERLPVGAVGLALRYFDADSFDGWTFGITVSD